MPRPVPLPTAPLTLPHCRPATGRDVLSALLASAHTTFDEIRRGCPDRRVAAMGTVRGTGPGVSFAELAGILERDHPVELRYPFEGSEHVGGAAWLGSELLGKTETAGVAKLHWKAGGNDLPMHTHETSDRLIVVLEGRGFFHCSDKTVERFDGSDVRTVAARERDVFVFTRGVVHTFSTADSGMTLLSCHLPYLPLDDPAQYRLPACRWTAGDPKTSLDEPLVTLGRWSSLT
ncbi:MAG: hypothetical protein CL958_03070 [Euryarchaeota archaeon]|nr:hypothetical protein [Marinobacter sp.]